MGIFAFLSRIDLSRVHLIELLISCLANHLADLLWILSIHILKVQRHIFEFIFTDEHLVASLATLSC